MELQRLTEMQQMQLQTQVTRDARAHIQVLGVWPIPAHSPCNLHQWAWVLGGLQVGEVCHRVDGCVLQACYVGGL